MFCNMLVDRPSYDYIIFDYKMFVTHPDCLKTLKTSLIFDRIPDSLYSTDVQCWFWPKGHEKKTYSDAVRLCVCCQFAVASTTTQTRTVS